jgi:hypothetical protein
MSDGGREAAPRTLAIVTGATSGIGAAFARALAARGHDLLITGRRRDVIESVAAEIRDGRGGAVEVLIGDLEAAAHLAALEDRIRGSTGLVMLVNNAGYGSGAGFLEDTIENQVSMLRVHAEATVRLCRAAATRIARGGAIVNVASMAGLLASPISVVYGATKAFLVSFSESLAMALRDRGIKVQALCPGLTRTDFHGRLGPDREPPRGRGAAATALWMTAERVVAASLAALARGKVVCVPGLLNRLVLAAARAVPRRLYYTMASRVRL